MRLSLLLHYGRSLGVVLVALCCVAGHHSHSRQHQNKTLVHNFYLFLLIFGVSIGYSTALSSSTQNSVPRAFWYSACAER